ncbi:FAD-binding oxidoreductase [Arenibaculum pallidiluteum]|uniref:FAD-binding oxidoreductase n=1 Tax=Arenibaculum pallidiluteum TaxID=2812559 RepID=UPI001A959BA1|nr:FAD-binding oxidoreductase [Arenibaculum pallidiluteum]
MRERFEAVVGPSGIVAGDELRARPATWTRPKEPCAAALLVRPKDTAELSAVLALCHEAGIGVVPRGGCTGLVDGILCGPGEIALSLERLTGIERVDPVAGTLVAHAGTTIAAVQEAAEAHGLIFPLDLGSRGSATVGGAIATNAGGLRVLRYGMMRDLVLGLEAVLADGTVLSSLKSLVKDNTGLDLRQLFIGTEGTLGIVTRAVLRLRPGPMGHATAMLACPGLDAAARVLARAQRRFQGRVLSFEGMWPGYYALMTAQGRFTPPLSREHPFYALVEIDCAGDEEPAFLSLMEEAMAEGEVLDAVIAASEEQRRSLWRIRESVELLDEGGFSRGYDVSVPLPALAAYVESVTRQVRAIRPGMDAIAFGHVGDNNIHWAITPAGDPVGDAAADEAVYGPLAALGGSVSAEHGIGITKRKALGLSRTAAEIAVMRAVKATLDPRGILNPGKVL